MRQPSPVEIEKIVRIIELGEQKRYGEMTEEETQRYFVGCYGAIAEKVRTRKLIEACEESQRNIDYGLMAF